MAALSFSSSAPPSRSAPTMPSMWVCDFWYSREVRSQPVPERDDAEQLARPPCGGRSFAGLRSSTVAAQVQQALGNRRVALTEAAASRGSAGRAGGCSCPTSSGSRDRRGRRCRRPAAGSRRRGCRCARTASTKVRHHGVDPFGGLRMRCDLASRPPPARRWWPPQAPSSESETASPAVAASGRSVVAGSPAPR